MTPQAQELLDRYVQRNKEIDREHNREMAKLYGGAALQIGSALVPGSLGLKVGSSAIKALTPYMGKKIAENVATGTISGLASGAVEGLGRGLLERENPLKTMLSDSALSALGGGAVGYMGGQLLKNLARNNAIKTGNANNYISDYINGLKNPNKKDLRDFRTYSMSGDLSNGDSLIQLDSANPLHVKQAELINKYNPAQDNYHTWVRNADDIHTFEDALKDPAYIGDGDFDPSYSRDMALQAIKDGEIDVYSSYPIDKGIFVSPSYMEAEQYAGGVGGKVYSKRVPLNDVAWIDPTQGQYAPIRELPKPVIKEEIKLTGEVPPYKESNFYKTRIKRREASQLNEDTSGLYEKLMNDSLKYRDEWVKIDGKDYRVLNLPKKDYGKILHILDTDLSKDIPIGEVLQKSDANYLYRFQKTSPTDYKFIGRKKLK